MFLQFSPVRRVKPSQKVLDKKESEEPTVLSLAPFTAKPKLFFEDIKVGEKATRELVIKNPFNHDVELYLTNLLPAEFNVSFNWHKALIKAKEDVVLCINWFPKVVCACRENITLEDGKKIKKDVSIVFKSIDVKNKKKKATFLSSKVKSPPPAERVFKKSKMQLSNQQFKETILPDIITTTPNKNNKIIFSSHLLPLRNLNDNSNHFLQNIKRETYILPGKVLEEEKENVFNDSLEMNTPFEKMIRENVFTPHSSPNVFQPTFCSSEEKSRSKLLLSPQLDSSPMNFSVRTYIINRANNISTKNLTYTKDLNNTSLKTIDFAQRSSFLCSSMKDEYKKRKYSPTLETITKTPKRLRSFQQSTTWDPFLLAATTNVDPFLMLDGEWIEEEVSRFTKWLNALLTPPSDLQSDAVHPVNVARMWRECSKGKEVAVAPTKELISNTYHVSGRLVVLREAAMNLFRKSDIVLVLKKVANAVDSGKLSVRNDRDLHLDLSLQSTIMSFLLSYNPLWLRIGLETIYSTVITLKHNSDMMGLSQFLMTRFFRDPYLLSKHKTSLSNNYAVDIKKFMLKKYLGLVYFLDQAKSNKLIKHDPCLFCKNAPIKESKEMLFQFSKEVLHAVGDITKYLKYFGYAVCHKQTFLDEFDYAVTNLGVDLRDGIRLTKTVEIVLLKNDLMQNLRAPAVSRLQKIHNVQVAFTALKDNGFEIVSDIDPRDIVNGHKEKTLSFLWQILFKFQGPLLKKSVTTIQKWWRSFPIVIKRRIFEKEREKQRKAVLRIEIWYKRLKLADALERIAVVVRQVIQELKLEKAVIKIQSYFRMYSQRIKYKKIKTAVLKRRNEAALLIQHFLRYVIIRRNYLRLKSAVIKTEEMYTAKKLMKEERFKFLRIKAAAIHIQVWYRSVMITRQIRNNYQKTLWAVKVLQTWHRANKQAKLQRLQYLELKATVQFIESRRKIKLAREQFLELKKATLLVQRSYRAKKVRQSYVRLKNSVVTIQSVFRATKLMQKQQNYYKDLKKSTIFIQRTYLAKRQRNEYLKMQKSAIKIQSYYKMYLQKIKYEKIKKSVLLIQKYIRKFLLRRKQKAAMVITVFLRGIAVRNKYLKLKNATVAIQTKYRAKKLMQQQLLYYQALRRSCICIQKHCRKYLQRYHAAVTIQRWYRSRKYHQKLLWAVNVIQARYRAKKQGRSQRLQYLKIKATVQLIENRLIAKIARNQFLRTRNAVILIQQFYRTRKIHINYLQLKKSTITIQTIFRANKMMQKQLQYYQDLKKSVVFAQRTFRAKKQRTKYLKMRENAIKIQSYYRMHCQKVRYEKTKKLVVLIQRNCRKFLLRRRQKAAIRIVEFLRGIVARNQYLKLKKAVGSIEERYRAKKLMQQQLLHYQTIKNATISIQRYYRKYLRRKHAAITIQRWYRTKKSHQKLLWAVSVIQRRFRARKEMILQRAYYLQLLIAVKFTQQTFRAKLTRKMYLQMKNSAVLIQCYYKMKKERLKYLKLRRAALVLQQHFRAIKAMKKERTNYLQLMAATILVQKRFRTNQLAKKERNKYIVLKCAVISMQRLYKTKKQRTMYLQLRYAVVLVQRRYRTLKHMRIEKTRYLALKQNTIVIQRYYRALQEMRRQHHDYLQLKRNTVMIQRRFRALKLMKIDRERFLVLKKTVLYVEQTYIARCLCTKYNKMKRAAIVIQKYYRSFYVMKKERVIFLCKLKTIYNIQRFARGFLARKKWGDLRNIDEFRQKRKEEQATVKIQAFWRGYCTRKAYPQLMQIRKRSIDAMLNAKASRELGYLKVQELTSENVSLGQILFTLQDIEFITRRCKTTCQNLCSILCEQVYIIICAAGRSLPEINICIEATSILINFCKYPLTTEKCWYPEYLDNIITVMQNCCDKDNALFSYLCTLLWLFAHRDDFKMYIVQIPSLFVRFEKIRILLTRKQNMVAKVGPRGGMSFFRSDRDLKIPALEPDWGEDRKDAPRTFNNAPYAFHCLLKILTDS